MRNARVAVPLFVATILCCALFVFVLLFAQSSESATPPAGSPVNCDEPYRTCIAAADQKYDVPMSTTEADKAECLNRWKLCITKDAACQSTFKRNTGGNCSTKPQCRHCKNVITDSEVRCCFELTHGPDEENSCATSFGGKCYHADRTLRKPPPFLVGSNDVARIICPDCIRIVNTDGNVVAVHPSTPAPPNFQSVDSPLTTMGDLAARISGENGLPPNELPMQIAREYFDFKSLTSEGGYLDVNTGEEYTDRATDLGKTLQFLQDNATSLDPPKREEPPDDGANKDTPWEKDVGYKADDTKASEALAKAAERERAAELQRWKELGAKEIEAQKRAEADEAKRRTEPPSLLERSKYDLEKFLRTAGIKSTLIPQGEPDVPTVRPMFPTSADAPDPNTTAESRFAAVRDAAEQFDKSSKELSVLRAEHADNYYDKDFRDPRLLYAEEVNRADRERLAAALGAAKQDLPQPLAEKLAALEKMHDDARARTEEVRTGFERATANFQTWAEQNGKTTLGHKADTDALWHREIPKGAGSNIFNDWFPVWMQTTQSPQREYSDVRTYDRAQGEMSSAIQRAETVERNAAAEILTIFASAPPPPVVAAAEPKALEPTVVIGAGLPTVLPSGPPPAPDDTAAPPVRPPSEDGPAGPPSKTTPGDDPPPPSKAAPTPPPAPPPNGPGPFPFPTYTDGNDNGQQNGEENSGGFGSVFEYLKKVLGFGTPPQNSSPPQPPPTDQKTGPGSQPYLGAPKAVVTLIVSPIVVSAGRSAYVSWSSINTKECDVGSDGKLLSDNSTDGIVTIKKIKTSTTVRISCVVEGRDPITAEKKITVE
ncbi:MAG: hypothetical protein G01um10148_397 [Parcubacteria group bacterium Gr01-1014_8]|nr:MAG: hypothetical protein G01um10148_397 [Parcubacteria group bacterium Gr01-1014_8]